MFVLTQLLIAEGAPPSLFGGPMLPILLMIGVFYFLILRPENQREKDRKQRLSELKRGDRVVLTGGMLGRVSRIDDDIAIIEIADKVKIRVLRKDILEFEDAALAKIKKDRGEKDDDKDEDKDSKSKDDESSRKAG